MSDAYVTVTSGLRGYFAVLVQDDEPYMSGIGSYATPEGAADEAREWAQSEGIAFRGLRTTAQAVQAPQGETNRTESIMSFGFGNRPANAAPAAPARSKYGGIVCADTRDPMPGLGTYRLRVMSCTQGFNPGKHRESYKVAMQVVEALEGSETSKGATVTIVHFLTAPGLADLKRLTMHAAGFGPTLADRASGTCDVKATLLAAEAAFDALDIERGKYSGAIIEASSGVANGAPSIVGRLVDVTVSKGKDVPNPQTGAPTGDYFRQYTWGVVPDAEQV